MAVEARFCLEEKADSPYDLAGYDGGPRGRVLTAWERVRTMENRICLRFCAALVLAGLCACGQWKVSALKGKTLATIKAGDSPGRVMIDYDGSGALNLSFS